MRLLLLPLVLLAACNCPPCPEPPPARQCVDPTPVSVTICSSDAQCDDHSACTVDSCVSGACAFAVVPAGSACATGVCDGSACCSP